MPEDEQPGCSQVVEEYEAFSSSEKPSSSHVLEEYEPFPSGGTWDPETYEIPDNGTQETYEVPEAGAEPETYEIPDPEPGTDIMSNSFHDTYMYPCDLVSLATKVLLPITPMPRMPKIKFQKKKNSDFIL